VANLLGNLGILLTYDVFITLGLLIAIPISGGEARVATMYCSRSAGVTSVDSSFFLAFCWPVCTIKLA
jgi:hypothetical protein